MPFTPLNPPEETEHDIEKHIREVELEQALKSYQEGLRLHYHGNWSEALAVYEDVLASDILADAVERDLDAESSASVKGSNQLQSSMAILPYLVFKNHASLLLSQANANIEVHSSESLRNIVAQALVQYATALSYDQEDRWLWQRIAHLSQLAHLSRPLGFCLEVLREKSRRPHSLLWSAEEDHPEEILADVQSGDSNLSAFPLSLLEDTGRCSQQTCTTLVIRPSAATWYAIGRSMAEKFRILSQYATKKPVLFHIDIPLDSDGSDDDESMSDADDLSSVQASVFSDYHIAGTNITVVMDHSKSLSSTNDHNQHTDRQVVVKESTISKRKFDEVESVRGSDEEHQVRASKRVKERNVENSEHISKAFFDVLNTNFEELALSARAISEIDGEPIEVESDEIESTNIHMDFKLLLYNDWNDSLVNRAAENSAQMHTENFSRTLLLTFDNNLKVIPDLETSVEDLQGFARSVNGTHSYCDNVILHWLVALTGSPTAPYMTGTWQPQLRGLFLRFLRSQGSALLALFMRDGEQATSHLYAAQAIFEILLDEYAETERARLTDASTEVDQVLLDYIDCWRVKTSALQCSTQDSVLTIRWTWVNIVLTQIRMASVEHLLHLYRDLRQTFLTTEILETDLPNCHSIPAISLQRLDNEIRKLNTMDFFEAVFSSTDKMEHRDVLHHLQPVLIHSDTEESSQVLAVRDYLASTPMQLQLQLWLMIYNAYEAEGSHAKVIYSSCQAIKVILGSLNDCQQLAIKDRQIKLVSDLNQIHTILKTSAAALRTFHNILDELTMSQIRESAEALIDLCALLQNFLYFEDHIADLNLRNTIAFERFLMNLRETVMRAWLSLYICYRHLSSAIVKDADLAGQKQASMMNVLHDELGTRGMCSLSDSWMLELFENELFRLNRAETEPDLIQIFHCKYERISFSYGLFTPWVHHSNPVPINEDQALQILPFISTFLTEKTPGVLTIKADLRQTLEELYEVTWKCVYDKTFQESAFFEDYLNSPIKPWEFRGCAIGRLRPQSSGVCRDQAKLNTPAWRDLAFNLARISFAQYKQRNKALVKGRGELEEALTYLQMDLLVSPGRQEAWQIMATIYSELADDEMSWNAQQIGDQLDSIVDLQKKSILSYMMALSLFVQNLPELDTSTASVKGQFATLLYDFAFQLYSAAHAPGSMAAFRHDRIHYEERGLAEPVVKKSNSIQYEHVLKMASRCFSRASQHCLNKWRCTMMLGKCHEKLKLDPSIALDDYVKALDLAPASISDQGPLLEPHYRLLSSTYKLLSTDHISAELAAKYLSSTAFSKRHIPEEITKSSIILAITDSIKGIKSADKKHWQHRPSHRLAMIALDQNNQLDSRTQFETLFNIRGSGPLLSIWRPDLERPGRHFVYTYRYARDYSTLLFQTDDMESIKSFLRRFRKATTNILHHKGLWEVLCLRFVDIVYVDPGPQEEIIDTVDTSTFIEHANLLEVAVPESSLVALRELYDLRKLNGGLFETGRLDDVIISCYTGHYFSIPRGSPQVVKKASKVTRREVLGKAFSLCKPRKPDVVLEIFESLIAEVLESYS